MFSKSDGLQVKRGTSLAIAVAAIICGFRGFSYTRSD
jgi:hypothetical protein